MLKVFSWSNGSSYYIVPVYEMFGKFHLFHRNKLWHHQELVWMMQMHSAIPVAGSPSRKTTWKLTIFTRKTILHNSKSSLVIRTNQWYHITFVIHERGIFNTGLLERENPSPYPWFGELLLITTMITISV